jgi:hypothetical protein
MNGMWSLNWLEPCISPVDSPSIIWINFYGKTKLFKEDFARLLYIFGHYQKSEIVALNLKKGDRKILKFLFQDYKRVKVLVK